MMTFRLRLLPVVIRHLLHKPDPAAHKRRLSFRVHLVDCDINLHLNNARYLSFMDIGRWDLFLGLGEIQHALRSKHKPVVVEIDIKYRRSLAPGQRFVLETELTHTRGKIFFVTQQFLVEDNEGNEVVAASAQIKGLVLDEKGKAMSASKALSAINDGALLVRDEVA